MIKEKKIWTSQEDMILKELRDSRNIKKWSVISKIMEEEFKIKGKNGKKCRERYQNHLNSEVKRQEWTLEQEQKLIRLHNEKGNKWIQIARQLQRSDNAVKNHYHSKLRKSLRRINKGIALYLNQEFKFLKPTILSRIIQTSEKLFRQEDSEENACARQCLKMKNQIISQCSKDEFLQQQIQQLRLLVTEINNFNKIFKAKAKRSPSQAVGSHPSFKYKGKEILNLIQQNFQDEKKNHPHISSSEQQLSSDRNDINIVPQQKTQSKLFLSGFSEFQHAEQAQPLRLGEAEKAQENRQFGNPPPSNIYQNFNTYYMFQNPVNSFMPNFEYANPVFNYAMNFQPMSNGIMLFPPPNQFYQPKNTLGTVDTVHNLEHERIVSQNSSFKKFETQKKEESKQKKQINLFY